MLRILQVANVGKIVGGTAACAWTIARALPWAEHHVAFLSPICGETRGTFRHAKLVRWDRVRSADVAQLDPDLILLHNTSRERVDKRLPAITLQYIHSRIAPAPADLTLCCSRWLADQYGPGSRRVLHQPVPIPAATLGAQNSRDSRKHAELIVGRLCTPQQRKWPAEVADLYRLLAARHPQVAWEFVGCPPSLQPLFRRAVENRAVFHEPGWSARAHLRRWDVLLYHHPTLTESFGRTCAESLRAGCVPVVDNRGGFREQLADVPQAGFLCDSVDHFDRALAKLRDPTALARFSRNARTHGNARFSLSRFARDFRALLGEVARHAPLSSTESSASRTTDRDAGRREPRC